MFWWKMFNISRFYNYRNMNMTNINKIVLIKEKPENLSVYNISSSSIFCTYTEPFFTTYSWTCEKHGSDLIYSTIYRGQKDLLYIRVSISPCLVRNGISCSNDLQWPQRSTFQSLCWSLRSSQYPCIGTFHLALFLGQSQTNTQTSTYTLTHSHISSLLRECTCIYICQIDISYYQLWLIILRLEDRIF